MGEFSIKALGGSFVSENKRLSDRIKEIDFSDIRLLIVGVVLLLVPVGYLIWTSRVSSLSHDATFLPKPAGTQKRKSFGFGEQPVAVAACNTRAVSPLEAIRAQDIDSSFQRSVDRVARQHGNPMIPAGVPATTRYLYEAEAHTGLKRIERLLEDNDPRQAIVIAERILANETNPITLLLASSYLCSAYEQLGMEEELRAEMVRLAAFFDKLPDFGFKADLSTGMGHMTKLHSTFSKMGRDSKVNEHIASLLSQEGASNHITPEELIKAVSDRTFMFTNPVKLGGTNR